MTQTHGARPAPGAPRRGLLRRTFHRLTTSAGDAQAQQLAEEATLAGCECIDQAQLRSQVRVRGTVTQITINPRGVNRWLEAVLSDGTGEITLVWMGRRVVRGIDAGRKLEVSGLLTQKDGRRTIYNPNYSLLA